MSSRVRVGVVGASGYTGAELLRLCAQHPRVDVVYATGDSQAGVPAASLYPSLAAAYPDLVFDTFDASRCDGLDAVFLGLPHEASMAMAPELVGKVGVVVDLSAAYRLKDASLYPRWYRFDHDQPELLAEAVYGLPELGREGLRGARLVANAGCYASAVPLAVAPFVKAGVVEPDGIAVTALSGVSGAGRKASEEYSFVEIEDDLRAYRIGRHQHTPEIEQTVARYAGRCGPISFTPVLVPIRRGILCTAHLRLRDGAGAADLARALEAAYAGEPFVKIRPVDRVLVKDVLHTNRCHVGVALDARAQVAVVTSALDNLVKGAAGRAVQAMNAVLGLPETAGLDLAGG